MRFKQQNFNDFKSFVGTINNDKVSFFLHGCTVHVDNIKSFICPTNVHTNYSKIVDIKNF